MPKNNRLKVKGEELNPPDEARSELGEAKYYNKLGELILTERVDEAKIKAELKKIKREELLRNVINWSVIILIISLTIIATLMIGTIAWHYIGPKDRVWLDEGRLRELKSFALSGVIGSLVTLTFNSFAKDLTNSKGSMN